MYAGCFPFSKSFRSITGFPLFALQASVFKQEDLGKLQSTGKCNKCDLSQADLKDVKLDDAKLCHTQMPD